MPVFFNGIFYAWGEAIKGLYRNRLLTVAAIGVVVITLLMLGAFMLLHLNINHITEEVKEQVEIVVYVDEEAGYRERRELRSLLISNNAVSEVRFVPREEALSRLKGQMPDLLDGLENENNPLRDSYEISIVNPEAVTSVARELEDYPGVASVFYGQDFVEALFSVTRVLQMIGFALMMALAVTAIFLIAHTIRLTVYIRQKEITIMKYVGATNWFIRWPFVLEGLTIGVLGAALPLLALYLIYQASVEWVVDSNLAFISLLPVSSILVELAKTLIPLGTGLGILGSAFSMGRFLRV